MEVLEAWEVVAEWDEGSRGGETNHDFRVTSGCAKMSNVMVPANHWGESSLYRRRLRKGAGPSRCERHISIPSRRCL